MISNSCASMDGVDSQFIRIKTWRRLIVCRRDYYSKHMQRLLNDPDLGLEQEILKLYVLVRVDSTIVGKISIDDQPIVVKRYNIKNFRHGLKKCLLLTRARRCWQSAHQLLACGIATPQPVAIVENRFGPLRLKSYYMYEYASGKTAREVFKDVTPDDKDFPQLASLLVNTLKQIHANNIIHGDAKTRNFLFKHNKVVVLDLDGMRFYPANKNIDRLKQKERQHFLNVNWWNNLPFRAYFERVLDDGSS